MNSAINVYFRYLNTLTVITAILMAFLTFFNKPTDLEFILSHSLAASGIPTAFALLCCALRPEMLPKLEGARVNIVVAGIALLYISVKGSLFL